MDKLEFRVQFFTHIQELAAREGFTYSKLKRGATNLNFVKPLTDGSLRAKMFLDCKYLPRVEIYFNVYYPEVTEVLFDLIGIERPDFLYDEEGWPCASGRLGGFLAKRGILEQKHATGTSFQLTEHGLAEAEAFVQHYYFEQAARMISSDTDTMVKMDTLINGHLASLGYPEHHIRLPHFMYTPFQSITGTILACMFNREDRQQLTEYHVRFMEDWGEGYQLILAEVVKYYVGDGLLKPSTQLDAALKYLK